MEIKKYTCHDKHRVTYGIAESLYCTCGTNIMWYGTYTRITIKRKRNKMLILK